MYLTVLDIDAEHRSVIVVVMSKENMDRMRNADPITLISTMEGGWMPVLKYCQISFILAYEEDWKTLEKVVTAAGATSSALLRYLRRGYQFSEALGDGKTGWKI